MTLGDKLSRLRKEHGYTQEQLAAELGVSRQAVGKWESDSAYPETDKLIRMGELYGCSMDYLLKDGEASGGTAGEGRRDGEHATAATDGPDTPAGFMRIKLPRERKSEKTVWGMPLWHVGRNARGFVAVGLNARGVIAVGLKARGVVSFGLLSLGVLSIGLLSVGLMSMGVLALGLLSAGSFAVGVVAAGSICLGFVSLGAIALGDFSVGALAMGKYFALGDHAQAMIAIGDSQATGSLFQATGELSPADMRAVKASLDAVVPSYLSWAKGLVETFL